MISKEKNVLLFSKKKVDLCYNTIAIGRQVEWRTKEETGERIQRRRKFEDPEGKEEII